MIENQIKDYFNNKEGIAAVYLYGSYASGQAQPQSDVDLAILFDNRDLDFVNKRMKEIHIELTRHLRKDLHLTALDFAGELLLKQILKTGNCLLVNDTKKLAYFTMSALSRIVDFQYHLDKMQSAMTRRVMEDL